MNTKTLRAAPYKLARLPWTVVDQQFAQRLPADSAPRLVFDRALGSCDQFAGRLLGDGDIVEQGRDRIARSEDLAEAVALERSAEAHREQAAEVVSTAGANAEDKRAEAARRFAEGLDEADAAERQGKKQATTRARSNAAADKDEINKRTKQRVSSVQDGLKQVDALTDAKLGQARRSAAAKRDDAASTAAEAKSARADANKLGQLSAAKRTTRTKR